MEPVCFLSGRRETSHRPDRRAGAPAAARRSRLRLGMALLTTVAGLTGCSLNDSLPRARLGALPFPGTFTLYASADTSELGLHRYTNWWVRPFAEGEGARGIMYTCRAGFLDLAHVREAVDWTRYCWRHGAGLIRSGGGSHRFENDGTGFELRITLPPWWEELPATKRRALAHEASIRIGQRVAYELGTWHEIITWHGWRSVFFVPEDGSSFTWEDTTSHLVGATIAGRVLQNGDHEYSRRASDAITSMMVELGAVPDEMVDQAARLVEGRWWRDGVAIRRDLDVGLEQGFKVPWVVPDLGYCGDAEAMMLPVPSLSDVEGRDLSGLYELRITAPSSILARLYPGAERPTPIITHRDFAPLIEEIRRQMAARFGAEVALP